MLKTSINLKTRLIIGITGLFFLSACGDEPGKPDGLNVSESQLVPKSNGELVVHTFYSLSYSEPNEQSEWVFYKLTRELVNGDTERTNDFREDPKVKTGSATLADYKGSGYDRGHLCPAGSMDLNYTSMSETFFLSNMSPQTAGFNRGVWKRLETQVREWVNEYGDIYVITGPVFKNNIKKIGDNQVTVPGSYYKIVFRDNDKMLGLLLNHESSSKDLENFAVPVDDIEALTGIDFFEKMDDSIEDKFESEINLFNWSFD